MKKYVIGICLLLGVVLCVLGIKVVNLKPDCVGCISNNVSENLVVVANKAVIKDKEELAKEIIKMRRENSFDNIKFMDERDSAYSLDINVYQWKKDIDKGKSMMHIELEPKDFSKGYDFLNHPEEFEMYIDGKLIE